jgi:exopolysaccharide production protein ExoY
MAGRKYVEQFESHKVLYQFASDLSRIARRPGGRSSDSDPFGATTPNIAGPLGETVGGSEVPKLEDSLRQKQIQLILKRWFDAGGAGLCLILLAPLLLAIGILVRSTSKGPALFMHSRVGLHGKLFTMYKFRSMQIQADPGVASAQEAAAKMGILVKGKNDARVTQIGRFLRSTSLDELPQLFNVLKGEMSFVGPRPLLPFMLAGLPEFAAARCLVRPGITGLWQVSERENNTSAHAMMSYDLDYLRRFNLCADLQILLRTPFIVVTGQGAC